MSFIATEQYRKSLDVMMQLRKIANHPLLIRHVYEDDKLRQMSRDILKVLQPHPLSVDHYRNANVLVAGRKEITKLA